MKIKIADLLKEYDLHKQAQEDSDGDPDDMTLSDEELEHMLQEEEDRIPSSTGNLEYTYRSKNNPDRLRLLTPSGELWDVLEMPDGHIGVQKIEVEIKFPMENFQKFKTWEEAEAALPVGWETYMGGAINA